MPPDQRAHHLLKQQFRDQKSKLLMKKPSEQWMQDATIERVCRRQPADMSLVLQSPWHPRGTSDSRKPYKVKKLPTYFQNKWRDVWSRDWGEKKVSNLVRCGGFHGTSSCSGFRSRLWCPVSDRTSLEKRSTMICHQCNNGRGQLSSVSKCWSWRSQVPDPPHAKPWRLSAGCRPSHALFYLRLGYITQDWDHKTKCQISRCWKTSATLLLEADWEQLCEDSLVPGQLTESLSTRSTKLQATSESKLFVGKPLRQTPCCCQSHLVAPCLPSQV